MGILDILVVVVDIEVDDDHGPLCELEVVVLGPLADQRHRVLLDELQDLLVGGGLLAQVEGAVLVGGMVDLGYVDRYRLGRHLELLRDGGIDGVKEPKTERKKNMSLVYFFTMILQYPSKLNDFEISFEHLLYTET